MNLDKTSRTGCVAGLLLALAVLGCSLPESLQTGETNTGANANTSPSHVETVAPSGNPREDVIRSSKKFLDLPRFSAEMQGTGKMPMHVRLDYAEPDRFHMTYLDEKGQVRNEMMIIGRDMYMKAGPSWQKMPGGGAQVPKLRELFDEKGLESLTDVKYVGEETIEGTPTHVYSYRNLGKREDSPYPFTSKIWVGKMDGLPHRIDVEYEGGDLKNLAINYDYKKEVNIQPPAK